MVIGRGPSRRHAGADAGDRPSPTRPRTGLPGGRHPPRGGSRRGGPVSRLHHPRDAVRVAPACPATAARRRSSSRRSPGRWRSSPAAPCSSRGRTSWRPWSPPSDATPSRRSPVLRALGALPPDLIVATGVVPDDGRTVPDLVIGPFGVAVVAEIGGEDTLRRIGQSWEMRTDEGWMLTEHPLDRAARDAERVRRWLGSGDLDFVVRVYAALVDDRRVDAALTTLCGHQRRPDPRLDRRPAPAAQPDGRADPAGRGAGRAGRRDRRSPARLVGEPGLEPGTSGI